MYALPTTSASINNEELNSLLTTIKNQGDEIQMKEKEIARLQTKIAKIEAEGDKLRAKMDKTTAKVKKKKEDWILLIEDFN